LARRIHVGHAERDVPEGGAQVVAIDAVVVGQFDFGMLGIVAVADERQRVLLLGPLGRAQQLHAEHAGVEVDGALQVAHSEHGVEKSHGAIMATPSATLQPGVCWDCSSPNSAMILIPSVRLALPTDARGIAEMSREYIEHGLGWSWTRERVLKAI